MTVRYVLSEYLNGAMAQPVYDKLEDGTFAGRIPLCKGVVGFGNTLKEWEQELDRWYSLGSRPSPRDKWRENGGRRWLSRLIATIGGVPP